MAKKPKTSAPTKEELLEEMHNSLTVALLERVRSGTATAADLNVARAFLKDNGIEVRPGANNEPLKELTDILPFAPTGTSH